MMPRRFLHAFLLICSTPGHVSALLAVGPRATKQQFRIPCTKIWNEQQQTNTDNNNEDAAGAEELLQSEINKLVEDPPIFSSWNEDNFDEEALPIPVFTAQIVSIASIALTAYIYYLGISGSPPAR